MPELTPAEIADQNLRHLCAVTGATYYPDHNTEATPLPGDGYVGPWVRITLAGTTYDILTRHVIMYFGLPGPLTVARYQSTCFYLFPSTASDDSLPYAERVASALLLLRNDPTIFVRWRQQDGPYA